MDNQENIESDWIEIPESERGKGYGTMIIQEAYIVNTSDRDLTIEEKEKTRKWFISIDEYGATGDPNITKRWSVKKDNNGNKA